MLITLLLSAGILLAIFLIGRGISIWYWKIDIRVKHLESIKLSTQQQVDILQKQLDIMEILLQKQGVSKLQIQHNLSKEIFEVDLQEWNTTVEKNRYKVVGVE